MKHGGFHILAGLCLLLCIAAIANRVSHHWGMSWCAVMFKSESETTRVIRTLGASTGCGVVMLSWGWLEEPISEPRRGFFDYGRDRGDINWKTSDSLLGRAGFGGYEWSHLNGAGTSVKVRGIAAPNWFLAILFAIVPGLWSKRFFQQRRRYGENCCSSCGYDIRESPERCPECGQAVAPSTTTAATT